MPVKDLRTYIKLEEALSNRLMKDWKQQSAPIYAEIVKACNERNWDEARRLVPKLDLTEIGEKNREWLKFMLRAVAIHGAGKVAGGKPSFVATGSFDKTLNTVASSMLQYLEHSGTSQVQQQALQLIAEDQEAHTKKGAEYSYGTTQIDIIDNSEAGKEINRLRSLIPEEDLAGDGKDVGVNHVTIRYGVIDREESIKEYLQQQSPFTLVLNKIIVFDPTDFSGGAAPVVVGVLSQDLHRMNEEIENYGDFKESSFKTYQPHITLAYIKPELIDKYKLLSVNGQQYYAIYATVVSPNKEREEVYFRGENAQKDDISESDLNVAGRKNPQLNFGRKKKKKQIEGLVNKADEKGRFVTPFVSFDNQGDDQLQLIATLNASRLATWGFTAEAEIRGVKRYKLTAILDGRTCDFCEEMNGKEFDVGDARDKVLEVLSVQDPNDLKTVQPWPKQDKESLDEISDMDEEELVAKGYQIPPYHPGDRCVLMMAEDEEPSEEKPEIPEEDQIVPEQVVTLETMDEINVDATQKDIDHYNNYLKVSPVEMLSKLSGKTPEEVLDGSLGSNPIKFQKNGDVEISARGVMDDVKYSIGTVLDPYSGTYYLSEADLYTGDEEAQSKFVKNLFNGAIDVGKSVGAKSLVVQVAEGDAAAYVKLGFLPSQADWEEIRGNALNEIESGSLKEMNESLSPDERLLVQHLLESNDEMSLSVLADLDVEYDGKTIGEWILQSIAGEFSLDMTDKAAVAQAKEYLGDITQKAEEGEHWVTVHGTHILIGEDGKVKAGPENLMPGLHLTPKENWPQHIKELKLPPAWHDVRISHDPKADLLAIGKDAKNRDQYVYSQKFKDSQAALKFERINALQKDIPLIDKQIKEIRKSGSDSEKEHADALLLIRHTGIRPGSEEDTGAEKKAYGATTLEGRHVVVDGNNVSLQFVGKKGVGLNLPITHPEVAQMLRQRKFAAGDSDQLFPHVSDSSLRDFVKDEMDHGGYHTKDFRTHLGTSTAQKLVDTLPVPKDQKSYVKAVKEVATQVSKLLGNTPTVALQSYIAPQVFGKWRQSVS